MVPWRRGSGLFSPASLLGGLVLLVFAVLVIGADQVPLVGWVLLGALAGAVVGSIGLQARRGHRGACALRRGTWFGVALPGAPVRLLFSLGI